jgi:uncharacterized protein (TIGR03435 family)
MARNNPRLGWIALFAVWAAFAQPQAARFEAASVRLSPPESMGMNARITSDDTRVDYRGISLNAVLHQAFGLDNVEQLSGPNWLNDVHVDIHATMPSGTSKERAAEMMQTLLLERFGLRYHREQRLMPVYRLKMIQGAAPLARSNADEPGKPPEFSGSRGYYTCRRCGMDDFAKSLTAMRRRPAGPFRDVDRNVINSTGLEGKYDFGLNLGTGRDPDSGIDDTRSAAQALKDIGLVLVPDRIPMEYVIVDQMTKTPTSD